MGQLLLFTQHPVQGRFRGQVDSLLVGQPRHDLCGCQVTILRRVDHFQHVSPLCRAELVGRLGVRSTPLVLATRPLVGPALQGAHREPQDLGGRLSARPSTHRFLHQRHNELPLFGLVSSASSPQIVWTFF